MTQTYHPLLKTFLRAYNFYGFFFNPQSLYFCLENKTSINSKQPWKDELALKAGCGCGTEHLTHISDTLGLIHVRKDMP